MVERDNAILCDSIVDNFNYDKCKENLKKLINQYLVYELEYHHINPPQITPNYEIRYEQFTGNRNDKILNYIVKKIDSEEELKEFYDNLYIALGKLTFEELKYFKQHYINGRSEESIMYQMHINTRYYMKVKKSCVVKLTLYFNIAVRV